MARHRAPRRRSPAGLGVAAVLLTGALVGMGVGLVPPQVTPSGSAAITAPSGAGSADTGVPGDETPRGAATDDATPEPRIRTRAPQTVLEPLPDEALPADSGEGRRVVFSQAEQRVWLVEEDGSVARTYLVSGSVYDNLEPGRYSVWSRSDQAWGIDDSGTMRWFVRFARGPRAAIGFHDIPVDDGAPVQTERELGTPLSHGCIRQRTEDALAMWEFAPLGTPVVVV